MWHKLFGYVPHLTLSSGKTLRSYMFKIVVTPKNHANRRISLAIGFLENQGLLQAPFSKIDANRDQCQSREEDDWKNPEDNDPDIGIIDVSPDLMRKYEQK